MISRGQQSTEGGSRTLYIGVGAVKVLGINPTKKQLEELFGREQDKEPEYTCKTKIDDKEYPAARISFIVKTVPEKNNGIELTTLHTFFVQKRYVQGEKSGKYKIIDKYGRTAWATREDIEAKKIPDYSNGPANIDADYRPCYQGEEEVTTFIKKYLNIPSPQSYINGEWVDNPKVEKKDCQVRLDNIDGLFKGDFKEVAELCSYQPENIIKIAFGVKTTEDNKQYQATYDRMCFSNGVSDYSKLGAEVQARKDAGGLSQFEYEITDLHEYVVDPTKLGPTLKEVAEANQAGEEAPW